MGAAAEWLSPDALASIALGILAGARPAGDKVASACPFHVEGTAGGAFDYDPAKDVGHCFSCDGAGDIIAIWNALHGRDLDDADGFREFRDRYAPDAARDGQASRPRNLEPRPAPPAWQPRATDLPPALWREKAGKFVDHASERLASSPDVLAQLAGWGVTVETARLCRLGWNDKDKYPPYSSWGMPKEVKDDGKERKIWLPVGLVIPFSPGGEVISIKVRRPNPQDGPESLRDLRYYGVRGGAFRYFIYGRPEWRIWTIVETERDAALLWQEGRALRAGAMATGSASAKPDRHADAVLRQADVILVALDADQAGAKNSGWWLEEYPNAVRWPVPPSLGKDPGDAVGKDFHGGDFDFKAWILAGLPAFARKKAEKQAKYAENGGENAEKSADNAEISPENANSPSENVQELGLSPVSQPIPHDIRGSALQGHREVGPGSCFQDCGGNTGGHWLDSGDDRPLEADLAEWLPEGEEKTALLELLALLRAHPVKIARLANARGEAGGLGLDYPPAWGNRNGQILTRIASLFWSPIRKTFLEWVPLENLPVKSESTTGLMDFSRSEASLK